MSRKTFDSSAYYEAKNNFNGYCLGCGARIGFSKYLIVTKKGDLRDSPLPNKLLVCNAKCEEEFLRKTLKNWAELRVKAFKRDGFVCQDCGRGPGWPIVCETWHNPPKLRWYYPIGENEDVVLEAHHITPISEDGPEFDLDNLVTLCFECHHLGRHGSKAPSPEEAALKREEARHKAKTEQLQSVRAMHITLEQFAIQEEV